MNSGGQDSTPGPATGLLCDCGKSFPLPVFVSLAYVAELLHNSFLSEADLSKAKH